MLSQHTNAKKDCGAQFLSFSLPFSNSQRGTQCIDCTWLNQRSDWPDLTLSALCYLAAEVGGTIFI